MSEHWKSTPKYWCKHCSTYVKDTPAERKQHESTGKHQGNLKRFLNGIQRDHAKNEREKDRAKAEIERLNRVAGASSSPAVRSSTASSSTRVAKSSAHLSAGDRKRQWAQLTEMGIAVPEHASTDMAMPGDWQTVSQKPGEPVDVTDHQGSIGVRKRTLEGREEDEENGEVVTKQGWGSTTKPYPASKLKSESLDSLLAISIFKKRNEQADQEMQVDAKAASSPTIKVKDETEQDSRGPKLETSPVEDTVSELDTNANPETTVQPRENSAKATRAQEQDEPTPVFKRRKIRQCQTT